MKALVDDVNHGSQEQANGIEQIGKAIVQMQQVTHQTAASAEESAAAAEELTAQSETLRAIVEGLTAMVGGGSGSGRGLPAARTRIAGAIRRPAPMPPSNAATAPGLRALATAVERKSPGPRMQPAPTGALAGKNAFPLDEDFSSF